MSGVSFEILEYLDRHPGAKDTLEGIVEWWLLETQIQHAIAQVKASLNTLVELQLVQVITYGNGRTAYTLNRRKQKAVRKLLRDRLEQKTKNVARPVVRISRRKSP